MTNTLEAPFDPFALASDIVDTVAAHRPITATFWGVPGHDGAWDDLSPEGHGATRAALEALQARLRPVPAGADQWVRLASDVVEDYVRLELERYTHDDHLTDLNNLASPVQMMTMAFDMMDKKSPSGWENVASRLDHPPQVR